SGESSAGEYPVEAVKELTRIAIEVEKNLKPKIVDSKAIGFAVTDALAKAAAQIVIELQDEIQKVIVVSLTGRTGRLLGRHRINQPLYIFTSQDYYARRMMLSKGINRTFTLKQNYSDRDQAVDAVKILARELGLVESG